MKKLFLLLFFLPLVFCNCSKDDNTSPYNEAQQNALNVFKGTFIDSQYGSVGEPLKITFTANYAEPKEFLKEDGTPASNKAHGEAIYYRYSYSSKSYEEIPVYIYLSYSATLIDFYDRNTGHRIANYGLAIIDENKFNLKSDGITMPYVMVKQ